MLALGVGLACDDGATEPTAPSPDLSRPATFGGDPHTLTELGATVQLDAQVLVQRGDLLADRVVSWSSSDTAVATVDGSGLVTARGYGTATITALAASALRTAGIKVESPDRAALVTLYEATDFRHGRLPPGCVA